MLKKLTLLGVLLAAGSVLPSCSNTSTSDIPPTSDTSTGTTTTSTGSMKDPKSSISYQLDLIKAGEADKLKACFTPRVRDGVTTEAVEKAKGDASKYTIDDLYASAEPGDSAGKKTNKVKMKSGRTLTTLVETDGEWLSDTIWFK